jgi:hypothetical protein
MGKKLILEIKKKKRYCFPPHSLRPYCPVPILCVLSGVTFFTLDHLHLEAKLVKKTELVIFIINYQPVWILYLKSSHYFGKSLESDSGRGSCARLPMARVDAPCGTTKLLLPQVNMTHTQKRNPLLRTSVIAGS